MKNIICMMVGHKPPVYAKKGWYSPGEEYGRVERGPLDGLGTEHCKVTAECARCHDQFVVCRIHLFPKDFRT